MATSLFCNGCLDVFQEINLDVRSIHGSHHISVTSLRRAAEDGCRICKAIWRECVTGFGKEDWSDSEVSTRFSVVQHKRSTVADAILEGDEMELRIEVERLMGNDEIQRDMVFSLLPYDPFEHCTAKYVRRNVSGLTEIQGDVLYDGQPGERQESVAHEESSSFTSRNLLSKWYRNCLENHKHTDCRSIFDGSYTPSRLLDIGLVPSDSLRLLDFEGKHLHALPPVYATLSHCWGNSQPLQLLTTNIQRMKNRIPRERIPRVFSEAIEVCRHQDIRYLWIDSLCILQDSDEDWARESQLMGVIYSRAVINIGATSSMNCHGSLFDEMGESASVAQITWRAAPQKRYIVVENSIEWGKSLMDKPLLRRAWVMQERFLATRMVHFTDAGLVWECRTTAATEAYPIKVPDALWHFHDRRNRFWRTEFTEDDAAWSVLISDYSKCELTFGKDKLVALAGLVSALEARGLARGRYWAGMWEADLPYCLLWTRGAIDKGKWPDPRPSTYRAPSWSWASLDYPIWTEWASGASELSLISHWEVQEEKGPNLAGSLLLYRPLFIRILGSLTEAQVARKRPWVEAIGRGIERVQGISYSLSCARIGPDGAMSQIWDDPYNDVVFDDFDETLPGKTLWCAPIYECEEWIDDTGDNNDKRLLGLLLDRAGDDTFRRVGAFAIGNPPDQEALKRVSATAYTIV
ncbi:HET-domain-containing protein [Bimuria novae-zelandiae CBS 107.79]|uniref:HET-domain-containing protein n=1 Tax=Bimuria novae-zelandiae CBS 107.79 TaxID=1447943 RepID=A0A6A5V0X9_9PLEO|nr:HET-domain-containing protein [Bimuria novae-zelandiae CBS 107.79]